MFWKVFKVPVLTVKPEPEFCKLATLNVVVTELPSASVNVII